MAGAGPVPQDHPYDHPQDHAADLYRARASLLAPPPGARRLAPPALRAALVDLHDLWLATRATAAGLGPGTALVAIGSLGRRELAPYSAPDLLLVHDGTRSTALDLARVAAALRAPGAGTDPVVRTVGEVVEASLHDLPSALALLDARLVAGDAELADRLVATARRAWRAGLATRGDDLVALTHARWRRAGDVAHRAEPDLVAGRGGLRDLTLLDALVTAGTADRPSPEVRAARPVLLDLRTDLHRHAGRAQDVLRPDDVPDPHDLLRRLGGAARAVAAASGAALRPLRPRARPRDIGAGALGPGVVVHGGELTLARRAGVARDPLLVLGLAVAAARTGLPMAPSALRRLADAAPELRSPWPDAARVALVDLLAADGLVEVVEALDRAGLWGRLLPEWGAVRDLRSAGPRHAWTVGRHLLEVTRHAARLAGRVTRPDLLLLAALVHDLGRGRADDPTEVSAALAVHVGRRLGLPDDDVGLLAAAVRHQDLLPRTARCRDPEDPDTARQVLVVLDGDPRLLELLHAFAEADARGTGPDVWTPWRARLLGDLVARCRAALPDGATARR
ncbi:HD domain-containing protein [Actinomycetospora sp. CA-084318]|uniref:HD domain-containing protein n=1 Tax=Actinomycetospora sp. CA-084318 TaxID=3239892 RepID=UPI003D98641D